MDRKRAVMVVAGGVLLCWGALAIFGAGEKKAVEAPRDHASAAVQEKSLPEKGPLTLVFAGDIMLSRYIEKIVQEQAEGDYSYPYALMGDVVSSADIGFANLETSVSYRGTDVGSIYSFRSNPEALPALREAGIDVVSIANNHIWDWSREAFLDTMAHLDTAGIVHAGGGRDYAEAHEPKLIKKNGHTVAFLAYTNLLPRFLLRATSSPAVALPTEKALAEDVAKAKAKGADIVIASFHWGDEYKREHNAYQDELAHAAIDAGADIVMGHHPHTAQEIETYKGGLIIYSLGNFVFDQNFDEFTRSGLLVRVNIDAGGKIVSHEPIEIRFNETYQPYVPAHRGAPVAD